MRKTAHMTWPEIEALLIKDDTAVSRPEGLDDRRRYDALSTEWLRFCSVAREKGLKRFDITRYAEWRTQQAAFIRDRLYNKKGTFRPGVEELLRPQAQDHRTTISSTTGSLQESRPARTTRGSQERPTDSLPGDKELENIQDTRADKIAQQAGTSRTGKTSTTADRSDELTALTIDSGGSGEAADRITGAKRPTSTDYTITEQSEPAAANGRINGQISNHMMADLLKTDTMTYDQIVAAAVESDSFIDKPARFPDDKDWFPDLWEDYKLWTDVAKKKGLSVIDRFDYVRNRMLQDLDLRGLLYGQFYNIDTGEKLEKEQIESELEQDNIERSQKADSCHSTPEIEQSRGNDDQNEQAASTSGMNDENDISLVFERTPLASRAGHGKKRKELTPSPGTATEKTSLITTFLRSILQKVRSLTRHPPQKKTKEEYIKTVHSEADEIGKMIEETLEAITEKADLTGQLIDSLGRETALVRSNVQLMTEKTERQDEEIKQLKHQVAQQQKDIFLLKADNSQEILLEKIADLEHQAQSLKTDLDLRNRESAIEQELRKTTTSYATAAKGLIHTTATPALTRPTFKTTFVKAVGRSPAETMAKVREKLRPIQKDIRATVTIVGDSVKISCDTNETISKAKQALGSDLAAQDRKLLKPQIRIEGLNDMEDTTELIKDLNDLNDNFLGPHSRIATKRPNYRDKNLTDVIIETDGATHREAMKRSTALLEFGRYKIYEHVQVRQCVRCLGIGHKSDKCEACERCLKTTCNKESCKPRKICFRCGGDHMRADCDLQRPVKCSVCLHHGRTINGKATKDHTDHKMLGKDCPMRQIGEDSLRRITDYT